MDSSLIRGQVLIGGYVNGLLKEKLNFRPRVEFAGLTSAELRTAAQGLADEGLVENYQFEELVGKNASSKTAFGFPLSLTEKGEQEIERGLIEAGQFQGNNNIVVVVSGGSVNFGSVGKRKKTITVINQVTVQSFQKTVLEQIESHVGSEVEKEDIKTRFQKFVEHPLFNTILGAALGVLTKT